ncbi:MAG TPA: VanZ family protein [Bacteroidales bacterium]|nr:VanZ family protein [Bacteroidales bacterium]
MTIKLFIKLHWPWMAWLGIILVLTAMPGEYVPKMPALQEILQFDKLAHILLFTGLVFLALRSFVTQYQTNSQRLLYVAIMIAAIAIGGITELMQQFVLGRHGSLYDFGADALGCLIGMVLFNLMKEKILNET